MALNRSRAPLGPTPRGTGTRFRLLAPQASAVSIAFFPTTRSSRPEEVVPARREPEGTWVVDVPGSAVGRLYAWSVDGPAVAGARFDPARLLLDPHGWEVARTPSARWCGLSRVPEPDFDWGSDARPRIRPARRVVCELHARGATRLHPGIPAGKRGSFAGLADVRVLEHFRRLGVTSLELLPVHAKLDEPFLAGRGLSNYWGYSTLCWNAPEPSLSSDARGCDEFRRMVREIHRAGMEVVLDVVYNHSCEGGEGGDVSSLRGFGSWYRRGAAGPEDLTGCGNTLDFRLPHVRRLVLDSLRHWVRDFHVDGFRFDLAAVHGRMDGGFDPGAPFFRELEEDPLLRGRILVAEPWDATAEGYALGRFPDRWAEWNDRFRDDVRLFWKGERSGEAFSRRMAGSPDLFGDRAPRSVNFVSCHDGFTLRDLCTYANKRNEANGEDNRDGSDWNHSGGVGPDGETEDPGLLERRAVRARNLLASALLARGVPMFQAGDELGRTQGGNNNAYCQDNRISWTDWSPAPPWPDPEWVASVLRLRRSLPAGPCRPWPESAPGAGGVLFDGHRVRWIVVGCLPNRPEALELPPGEWRLVFDSASGARPGAGDPVERIPGGVESLFVLRSPPDRRSIVKGRKSAAVRPRGG